MLIDEAERAMVVALTQPIEERLGESETEAIVGLLFQLHVVQLTGGVTHLELKLLLNAEVAVVDQISWPHTIDAEQLISGFEAKLLTNRARLDAINHRRLGLAGDGIGIKGRDRDPG